MPPPTSILQMCIFGNTITLAVLSMVLWIFIVARVKNTCAFWGGYHTDLTNVVIDMVNTNNWCTVTEDVVGQGIGLMVGMWLNFTFSAIALWFREYKPVVGFNLAFSFPIQIFFAIVCFIVAAAAGNSKVAHPNAAVILCGVMMGLLSLVTPGVVYTSLFLCRKDVIELPGDREEAERAESRRFELRVRSLTNEIVQHRELEKKFLAQRGRGRGGRGRGGGAPAMGRGAGGGGRGGIVQSPSGNHPQSALPGTASSVSQHEMASTSNIINIAPNNNSNMETVQVVASALSVEPQNNDNNNGGEGGGSEYTSWNNDAIQ